MLLIFTEINNPYTVHTRREGPIYQPYTRDVIDIPFGTLNNYENIFITTKTFVIIIL